jgi:hypothetical protein
MLIGLLPGNLSEGFSGPIFNRRQVTNLPYIRAVAHYNNDFPRRCCGAVDAFVFVEY